jgi:hypothetical protein
MCCMVTSKPLAAPLILSASAPKGNTTLKSLEAWGARRVFELVLQV